ncbi:hypothetical protein [Lysinibacillus sp. 3P01SB]|uniref:hypothetical protein n=1 Tax=Lysinibacillus sp. 3P01SB TaxID=3132284 RepID=UPI0039A4DE91
MRVYLFSINLIGGKQKGIVFVEEEWEVTSNLGAYYGSTEEELLANGLEYKEIKDLSELQPLTRNPDMLTIFKNTLTKSAKSRKGGSCIIHIFDHFL